MRSKSGGRALHPSRAFLRGVAVAGLALALEPTPAFAEDPGPNQKQCEFQFVPVALAEGLPTTSRIATWLCYEGSPVGKTVQVLIHGMMFNHYMWDFPLDPEHYSYVNHAIRRGYVTLNLDRLGSGLLNDHPPATQVDQWSNVYAIHQIIQALRAGGLGSAHERFSNVVVVGSSLGSTTSLLESALYDDVDAVLLSGFAHELDWVDAMKWISTFYPANQDPKYAPLGFPEGYLTTRPGWHPQLFLNLQVADPAVAALDEVLKGTATTGELATGTDLPLQPQYSLAIHVPVMIADGGEDAAVCSETLLCRTAGDIIARESAFWSPAACLEAFVLPRSGHNMNEQYNAVGFFAAANDWLDRRVGRDADHPATQPCQVPPTPVDSP